MQLEERMKFKQKVFIFIVILIVDMILAWGAVRMWKGRGEIFDTHEGKPVDTGRIPVPGEEMTTEVSGHDHSGAGRSEKAVSDLYDQQEDIAKKYTALTFDDGPNPKYTKPLLDGLRERGIRVTFFLVGECIDGNEDLVKQMAKDGHLIGVHCLTHKDLTKEKLSDAAKELCDTREKIRAVTGTLPEYVRPPYGNWNAKLEEAVDMIPVFWDVDSIDWRLKNTEKVTEEADETENTEETGEVDKTSVSGGQIGAQVSVSGWNITVEDVQKNTSLENVSVELGYTGVEKSNYQKEAESGKTFFLVKMLIEKDGSKETIDWSSLKLTDSEGNEYTRMEDEFLADLGMMRMTGNTLNFGKNEGWIAFEINENADGLELSYPFEEEAYHCAL